MLSNPAQIDAWQGSTSLGARAIDAQASPYTDRRFAEVAAELADADFIVMHRMGYDASMRATVAAVSHRPVLLSRAAVAAAIRLLLSGSERLSPPAHHPYHERLGAAL